MKKKVLIVGAKGMLGQELVKIFKKDKCYEVFAWDREELDITKEKESQDKLEASENRLATLILNLDNGVLLEDKQNNIAITNRKFCQFFSLDKEPKELVGLKHLDLIITNKNLFENPEQFISRIEKLINDEQPVLHK